MLAQFEYQSAQPTTTVQTFFAEADRARLTPAALAAMRSLADQWKLTGDQAAQLLGVPLIHLSTDYVYPGDKPSPYVESDPTGPASVYVRSKLEGEEAVLGAHPGAIIFRAWRAAVTGWRADTDRGSSRTSRETPR